VKQDLGTIGVWRQEYLAGRYGEVEKTLDATPEALNEVARIYFLAGKLEDARATLERAKAKSPNGLDFIVMEYVPGTSIGQRLRRGPIPEREAVTIAIQITEALAEAHARGIIHRDIKPSNVIVTPRGEAKLLDFGLVRMARAAGSSETASRSLTETGQVVGTLPYMAPEVLRGEKADARTDIYGVGILLFEMTTGRRPFLDDQPHELMYTI
jgi:serine/threonine-protein kinase